MALFFARPLLAQHHPAPRSADASGAPAAATAPPLRVVFHLLVVGHLPTVYSLQNITATIQQAEPSTRFVVVVSGAGVTYFRRSEPSNVATLLAALIATGRVECRIDGVSLTRGEIPAADVLPGLTIVPSGLLDIARLEREGYAYVTQ